MPREHLPPKGLSLYLDQRTSYGCIIVTDVAVKRPGLGAMLYVSGGGDKPYRAKFHKSQADL